MKEITEERVIKTKVPVYVSDDGLYKSEDKFNVEQYEKGINKHQPVKLFESNEIDDEERNNHWKVYRCSNFEEFQATVSVVCKHHKIHQNDISKIYEQYKNNYCLYAFFVEEAEGDNYWDELDVITCAELIGEYTSEILSVYSHLERLREERDKLYSLRDREEE